MANQATAYTCTESCINRMACPAEQRHQGSDKAPVSCEYFYLMYIFPANGSTSCPAPIRISTMRDVIQAHTNNQEMKCVGILSKELKRFSNKTLEPDRTLLWTKRKQTKVVDSRSEILLLPRTHSSLTYPGSTSRGAGAVCAYLYSMPC